MRMAIVYAAKINFFTKSVIFTCHRELVLTYTVHTLAISKTNRTKDFIIIIDLKLD